MSRRFFHLSLGILCLAVAYNLGARNARAEWDTSLGGLIIGGEGRLLYSASGEAYLLGDDGGWTSAPDYDLPVAAGNIKLYLNSVIVTHTDEVWHFPMSNHWELASPFPGSGTPVEKDSWGGVKQRWR